MAQCVTILTLSEKVCFPHPIFFDYWVNVAAPTTPNLDIPEWASFLCVDNKSKMSKEYFIFNGRSHY
jgi:hypothetical protein